MCLLLVCVCVYVRERERERELTARLPTPPIIQSVYIFKAKATAEKKELEARGMKAGSEFVDCKHMEIATLVTLRDQGFG